MGTSLSSKARHRNQASAGDYSSHPQSLPVDYLNGNNVIEPPSPPAPPQRNSSRYQHNHQHQFIATSSSDLDPSRTPAGARISPSRYMFHTIRALPASPKQQQQQHHHHHHSVRENHLKVATANSSGSDLKSLSVKPVAYKVTQDPFVTSKSVVALYDHSSNGKDDLQFQKGDRMLILDDRHRDWWYARNIRTHESGYIPVNYVSDTDDLKAKDWFFDDINLREAEWYLDQPFNTAGTFLIRPSGSTKGNFALSILDINTENMQTVKQYRIRRTASGQFFIGPKANFVSLTALVEYYSEKSEGLCNRLTKPCPKGNPTLPDLSYNDLNQIEMDRRAIKLTSLIGNGNYAEVWKGKYRSKDVAVKIMKTQKKNNGRDFLDEARLMKDLHHRNVVRLYGVSTSAEPLYIIVEYMLNGSLLNYLRSDMGQALKLPKLVNVAAQVANGMSYLENKHFVHCDLAARNILVGEAMHVKIGDFGLARIIRSGKLQVESQAQFPIKWTAPEAATKKEYTIKSDVWSFGVLLFELITKGSVPYPAMSNQETLQAVSQGYRLPKPNNCPDSFYSVMSRCWNSNPDLRPTFDYLHNMFDDFFVTTEPNYRESETI